MSNPTGTRRSVPRRPVRAVLGGVIGVVLSATVIAFAGHQWFYVIVLYGFLIGACGGLMAWMVLDELDPGLQGTRTMAVAGLVTASITYLLYEQLSYRFAVAGLDVRPGWLEHLVDTAREGASFGRLGRSSTIHLGAWFVWGARVLELGIAMFCGAGIARAVDFRR